MLGSSFRYNLIIVYWGKMYLYLKQKGKQRDNVNKAKPPPTELSADGVGITNPRKP
jgi:hypothetical protein